MTKDLISPNAIKELLQKYHTKPSNTLGQHFLIKKSFLATIIEAANLSPNDTVLEIGPGTGVLTQALAKQAKKVVAIDKDEIMTRILKETLREYPNVEIVNEDALRYVHGLSQYKLVANLPYYATSFIIRNFLEAPLPPQLMVLMIQKEVAQRICAHPPHMTILAASVQFYATPNIVSYVPKEAFWPKPKVDSAIIKITPLQEKRIISPELFFKVVKAGFVQPRKQLANNLSNVLKKERPIIEAWLIKNNLPSTARAESLTIEQWILLAQDLGL